jgi:hypothetical protein
MKLIAPVVVSALALLSSSAVADDTLARFKGGIGVIPVSSGVGTGATAEVVNRNIVRNVQPAGQPWVIRDLDATVKTDGGIQVINDLLSPAPAACNSPVLLIRNAGNLAWFAAGIPDVD